MITVSDITGKVYDDMEAVFYRNVLQSSWMISHPDVELLDLFTDSKMKLVFVFKKSDHRKYLSDWIERKNKEVGDAVEQN